MGNKPAKDGAKELDATLQSEAIRSGLKFKILCLGPGESGKSTVVKQLRLLHNDKMNDSEKKAQISVLAENTLQCMQSLIKAAAKFEYKLDGESQKSADRVTGALGETTPEDYKMTTELAADIALLWKNESIQKSYARRSEFWLLDNADYYFGRVKEFSSPNFSPSDEDLILARARTTGIIHTEFPQDDLNWLVVDVGGQRSERKKWINCFDDVKAVLFVVNLSGYDSVLFEDEKKNRMAEAVELFEQVCAEKVFVNTPIYLFFNKKDLFEERLKSRPITLTYPEFKGNPEDGKECIDFMAKMFLSRVSNKRTGPPIHYWSMAARFQKDVRLAFTELKEKVVQHYKRDIIKAVNAVKKDEAKTKSKDKDKSKS